MTSKKTAVLAGVAAALLMGGCNISESAASDNVPDTRALATIDTMSDMDRLDSAIVPLDEDNRQHPQ